MTPCGAQVLIYTCNAVKDILQWRTFCSEGHFALKDILHWGTFYTWLLLWSELERLPAAYKPVAQCGVFLRVCWTSGDFAWPPERKNRIAMSWGFIICYLFGISRVGIKHDTMQHADPQCSVGYFMICLVLSVLGLSRTPCSLQSCSAVRGMCLFLSELELGRTPSSTQTCSAVWDILRRVCYWFVKSAKRGWQRACVPTPDPPLIRFTCSIPLHICLTVSGSQLAWLEMCFKISRFGWFTKQDHPHVYLG